MRKKFNNENIKRVKSGPGTYELYKLVASLAFSGGLALLISGIKDVLDQNNDANEIPV